MIYTSHQVLQMDDSGSSRQSRCLRAFETQKPQIPKWSKLCKHARPCDWQVDKEACVQMMLLCAGEDGVWFKQVLTQYVKSVYIADREFSGTHQNQAAPTSHAMSFKFPGSELKTLIMSAKNFRITEELDENSVAIDLCFTKIRKVWTATIHSQSVYEDTARFVFNIHISFQ